MILTLVTGQLATVSSLRGIDAGETHLAILKAAAGYHIRTAGGVCCWILSIWPNIWVITWTMVSSLQHGHPDQEKKRLWESLFGECPGHWISHSCLALDCSATASPAAPMRPTIFWLVANKVDLSHLLPPATDLGGRW